MSPHGAIAYPHGFCVAPGREVVNVLTGQMSDQTRQHRVTYGLNFFGIAATSSGVIGVIVFTMHGDSKPRWPVCPTRRSQSTAEHTVLGPRVLVIRNASGNLRFGQLPVTSSR